MGSLWDRGGGGSLSREHFRALSEMLDLFNLFHILTLYLLLLLSYLYLFCIPYYVETNDTLTFNP